MNAPTLDVFGNPTPALEDTAVQSGGPQDEYQFFRRGALVTVALSCVIAFSLNLVDPDLWGHVKYGQEVIADGKLPETATYTYTAEGYRWINHENLAEIAFSVIHAYFGNIGLTLGKCLLGLGILGLMVVAGRQRNIGPLILWALLLVVALNLGAFFPVRPQLLSFACCAIMLFLLDRGFPEWPVRVTPSFRWLWCLPLLMILWVNSHGGFVAGLGILLLFLVGRCIELHLRERERAWTSVRKLAVVAACSFIAVLVNPYGVDLPLWLASALGRPRPEITEWAPLRMGDPVFIPFVILGALFVLSTAFDRRRRDWTQIIILCLVMWQSVVHVRHIAFFAILCGFWLPAPLNGLVSRMRSEQSNRLPQIMLSPWLRRGLTALLAAIFFIQTYALTARIRDLPVFRHMYPVDAVEFMANHQIQGRLVVAFNWAQYAIAALSPDVQVQFDGRFRTCYPQEVIDQHFDFLLGDHEGRRYRSPKSGPIDSTAVLSAHDPDLVLVDRGYPHAVQSMELEMSQSPDKWILLYQDGIAQLYGTRSRFDDPQKPHYVPPSDRVISDTRPEGYVSWPALPATTVGRFVLK